MDFRPCPLPGSGGNQKDFSLSERLARLFCVLDLSWVRFEGHVKKPAVNTI